MMNRLTTQIARMAQTNHARNAGEKAQEKAARKQHTPVHIVGATTGTRIDPVSKYLDKLNPEAKALIARLAIDLKMEHPDWSRDKIYQEAKRLLPSVYRSPKSLPT